jgi:hypothetical protein
MAIDIARRFHMDLAFIDLPALPLPATYCVYRATMFYISFAGEELLGDAWLSNFESLTSTLGHFSKRWSVGSEPSLLFSWVILILIYCRALPPTN